MVVVNNVQFAVEILHWLLLSNVSTVNQKKTLP